jgi:hypothetical protein
MKKLSLGIVRTFLLLSMTLMVFSACENSNTALENQQELSAEIDDEVILKDINFIQMKKAIDAMNTAIASSLQQQNISFDEFKQLYQDQNEARFNSIFNDQTAMITKNLQIAKKNYEALVEKYPQILFCTSCDYNQNPDTDEIAAKLNSLTSSPFEDYLREPAYSCRWQFYVCLAAAGFPAFACIIASTGLTAGLVSGLCVAGFGAAAVLCLDGNCTRVN